MVYNCVQTMLNKGFLFGASITSKKNSLFQGQPVTLDKS